MHLFVCGFVISLGGTPFFRTTVVQAHEQRPRLRDTFHFHLSPSTFHFWTLDNMASMAVPLSLNSRQTP
jgi:hypothetical protein